MNKDNGGPASDRELLEMAAKAAGIARSQWDYEWLRGLGHMMCRSDMWNPLTDDGDALRLAVKLGLCILCHATQVEYSKRNGQVGTVAEQTFRNEAATRRAIVRAAAAIGSAM